jgi:tRNA(fMet)-specific endonuclease VapC
MTRYMLDTNMVSHLLKQHAVVVSHVLAVPMHALCISAITEGELLFGLAKRPDNKKLQQAVQELLRRVESIPWDSSAAQKYGQLRASMEQQGKGLGNLDLLIASHAASINATLVTNDRAINQVPELAIEDWTHHSVAGAH